MQAQYLIDGTIAVTGASRTETFVHLWAGIGWPDRESGYVCAVGQRADGRYHALWEESGGLWELGRAAVKAKDRLLIDRFLVDGRDTLATSYVRAIDGLCFHDDPPSAMHASMGGLYKLVKNVGPQQESPTASVIPVPERITEHVRSALEKTRGLIMQGQVLIHETNCPKLVYTIRQPLEDLVQSPVMKALVWVVTALDHGKTCEHEEPRVPEPWYTNGTRHRR